MLHANDIRQLASFMALRGIIAKSSYRELALSGSWDCLWKAVVRCGYEDDNLLQEFLSDVQQLGLHEFGNRVPMDVPPRGKAKLLQLLQLFAEIGLASTGAGALSSEAAAAPLISVSRGPSEPVIPSNRISDHRQVELSASSMDETPSKSQKLGDNDRIGLSNCSMEKRAVDIEKAETDAVVLESPAKTSRPGPAETSVPASGKSLRRRLCGKQSQAAEKTAGSGTRISSGSTSGLTANVAGSGSHASNGSSSCKQARSQEQIKSERALLLHPWASKEPINCRLYPRMYKQVMEALKSGQLPATKMQVTLSDDLVQWFVRLKNFRPESLFGQTSAEIVVQLVWEYYQHGQSSQALAFPDVAPIMRVLTPTGIYTDGKAGVCVMGLSGGGTWHGLEFKESINFSHGMKQLIGHPSYEYKVQKEGTATSWQGQSNSIAIKERGTYNEVVSTRSLNGKPFVMDRCTSPTHYMQKLLNHFEFEDWRNFTEDELRYPIGGFQRKVQQAYKPLETHAMVVENQKVMKQVDQDLSSKQHELRELSALKNNAKRGPLQRQINSLTAQKETAVQELERYKQKVDKLRQDVEDKLRSSSSWNQSKLGNLMCDLDEQERENQKPADG